MDFLLCCACWSDADGTTLEASLQRFSPRRANTCRHSITPISIAQAKPMGHLFVYDLIKVRCDVTLLLLHVRPLPVQQHHAAAAENSLLGNRELGHIAILDIDTP
jgi:hypothetical protein